MQKFVRVAQQHAQVKSGARRFSLPAATARDTGARLRLRQRSRIEDSELDDLDVSDRLAQFRLKLGEDIDGLSGRADLNEFGEFFHGDSRIEIKATDIGGSEKGNQAFFRGSGCRRRVFHHDPITPNHEHEFAFRQRFPQVFPGEVQLGRAAVVF
ncbi:MAG TPA: hypothetical protein VFI82_11500 [Terriglobales bacterium]|nr:hypothetical protein [Terriglobales bacterium]